LAIAELVADEELVRVASRNGEYEDFRMALTMRRAHWRPWLDVVEEFVL